MRKIILSLLGVLLIIGAFFASKAIVASNQRTRPKPKKVIKTVFVEDAVNGVVPIEISANGNLVAQRRLEIFSEVQGVLQKGSKLFKPGQEYRKGQTLLSLNSSEYYASVQSQKSALYDQITSIMPDLRLDYPKAYPKWQAYLNNFDVSKATPPLPEITSEKEGYFISGRNIQTAYYNVKNLEQRLGKYRITAPFTGVLTEALVTEGTLVRSGQKLGEFIDTSLYELEVAISKNYADLLQVNNEVTLSTIDGKQTYTGKVTRVNGNINQDSQTINAYIEVQGEGLREGVYLEALLQAKEEQEAISLPRGLLQPNNELFMVRDSILDVIAVNPVYFSDKEVVVKGIPEGTKIVSKPVPGAYAGMLVKIYSDKESSQEEAE
ncbi:efflux RND transporter periplasmic adaptor subunit [Dokdonia donghaensis]|uniref:RND transporter n=1 Tax=Dokdonia donghaensis DSW-1 TaxID=1300343 RepID=A0A0A2GT06_9FLAO|nr:HlyD family efflux transporter periplasmic adaptor subunit [Dokdonia donghaensis]ANH58956.1 periplasmic multidrug efflux lipoprotein precursor [Dokdonia donghaensis DSW-1]ANH61811.1 periplasmic multidrug efflux lipoprotein precursor [Dokdonia donghaensis DSW-1]KGO06389.1 RND transporter [Dokdonia donghaensis DSW-1]